MSEPAVTQVNEAAIRRARVAFVLPQCTHYTQGLFETLAARYEADFFFFSDGKDWYWEQRNGYRRGRFRHEYLSGFRVGSMRILHSLPKRLLSAQYDAIVAAIDGRFALPVSMVCARLKRIPFVLWTGIWNRIDTLFHRTVFPVTRFVYRNADSVVTYGTHVRRYLEREGVQGERIFVAPHAVDNAAISRTVPETEATSLRKRVRLSESQLMLLFVGRLEPVKGVAYLLEAMIKLRRSDVQLVIVGNGSEGENLRWAAGQLGLQDRVYFVGYVSPEQTRVYYAAAFGFVLPSVTTPREKETWGSVVNEAMNQGVPVIATEAVGAAAGGLVLDGVNGFVVPEKDSSALARAIETLAADALLRKRMSDAARSAVTVWNHERMADGFGQALSYVFARSKSLSAERWGSSAQTEAGGPA